MNNERVVSEPLIHFELFLRILPLEQLTSEFFKNSSQNSNRIFSTYPQFSFVEFTIKISTELDKHQLEEFWLEKILSEKLDGFGIVSVLFRNFSRIPLLSASLIKWGIPKTFETTYSVGILSVDQMASEFFKRIPVWIPIGYFLLTRNFSFVEFTIKISTEVNINLGNSDWKISYQRK